MTPSTSIIGHKPQLESLRRDLETGNIGHAYLFAGPRHVGKMTIAKWFASQLLARDSANDLDVTTEQVKRLLHPDLLVLDQLWMEEVCEDADVIAKSSNVSQEHRRKAKAKSDTIGIDDVRALHDRLIETGIGTHRCCIIRSVERMQDEAVNALLKILEEPPPGVVFLLTTQAQSGLLPTLVSRARVFLFPRLPAKELQPLLSGVDAEEAAFLLKLAQGAPGIIQQFRHDPDALRVEQSTYADAHTFWRSTSLAERLRLLAPFTKGGANADRLLTHLAIALRDQFPSASPNAAIALDELIAGLQTNVSGQLLAQRFALQLD